MAPKMNKKVIPAPAEDYLDDLNADEVVINKKPVGKKSMDKKPKTEKKSKTNVSDDDVLSNDDSKSDSDSKGEEQEQEQKNGVKVRKTRKASLEKVHTLLKNNKVTDAMIMIEEMINMKKEKKPREPSVFNLFIKYQMQQFKNDKSINTNEKMKKCSEVWKKDKFDEFAKKRYEELTQEKGDKLTPDERITMIVKEWQNKQ